MAYFVAAIVLVAVVYGIVQASTGNRYASMTEAEFEAEAKRASLAGAALTGLQKAIDPGHRIQYMEEAQMRAESDSAESGDGPNPGQPPAPKS